MKIGLAGVLALMMVAGAGLAQAKPVPQGGLTPQEVASWLQERGYKASLGKTSDGDPRIVSAAQGVNFNVNFYDCDNGRCASIQFAASWNTDGAYSPEKANAWNSSKRWATASMDEEHDPWLAEDVSLSPGGTYESLGDEFQIWNDMLSEFLKTIQ